jgi:hypothetical protein
MLLGAGLALSLHASLTPVGIGLHSTAADGGRALLAPQFAREFNDTHSASDLALNGPDTGDREFRSPFATGADDLFVFNQPAGFANPDAFRLTPEPGFYGVLALGLAGLAFVVIRRRPAENRESV